MSRQATQSFSFAITSHTTDLIESFITRFMQYKTVGAVGTGVALEDGAVVDWTSQSDDSPRGR
jgi:hypothetical protein